MTEMYDVALDGGKDINHRTKALDLLDLMKCRNEYAQFEELDSME